jgi:hypothetical protein
MKIVTAFENPRGKLFIIVAAGYTDSLFLHLKSKNVKCLPPHELPAILFPNKTGELETRTGHLIVADGTTKDFNDWVADWEIPII